MCFSGREVECNGTPSHHTYIVLGFRRNYLLFIVLEEQSVGQSIVYSSVE